MKTNRQYWHDRFIAVERTRNRQAKDTVDAVIPAFDAAMREIENQINTWYNRYSANNQISLAEAKRQLSTRELKEFQWDVDTFIKYGRDNAIDSKWQKQLENASVRYHISRLEALKIRVQQAAEVAFGNELDELDQLLPRLYTGSYYHTAYEIQKGLGIAWDIGQLDQTRLTKILQKPWTVDGYTFSNRIWKAKQQLIEAVSTEMTQMCILGGKPDQAIKNLAHKMQVSKSQAGRLIMTESAYFGSKAQQDCFNDLDVEKYEIVATLDWQTSKICQMMDGKVFDLKDYQSGVTAPPFHPWCRSCTCPFFDDEFTSEETRAARGEDGKTYQVPANMKYQDWKDHFVDKVKDPTDWLKQAAMSDIIQPKKFIQFHDGEAANQFFYYDDYERNHGLIAKRNGKYGKWRSGLSEDSVQALYSYTADGYGDVNDYLRKINGWESINAEMIEEQISKIDDAIDSFELKDSILVQRGANQSSLDVLFENYDIDELTDLIGKKYHDDAFMSSTALYGNPVATTKPVVFDISIPSGKGRGAYINEFGSQFQDAEYEFLIKRGASFTITDISEDVDLDKIYVKMVMDVE